VTERLYGVADVGGTYRRVEVWNDGMELVGQANGTVHPEDYEGTVRSIADSILQIADGNGELVAVGTAVASEIGEQGRLVLGGALSPWSGKRFGVDIGAAVGLPQERSGTLNDMTAAAVSQLAVNQGRGIHESGYVSTLSSGWGGKPYRRDGEVGYDSPGHAFLRDGAECPCGGHDHTEAFLSGKGVELNHGVQMKDWLSDRRNARQFVTDLSIATITLVERNRDEGFPIDVMRWMGGVATGQPVLMARAEAAVRDKLGNGAPLWEAVSFGGQAGLHGAFVEARRLAEVA